MNYDSLMRQIWSGTKPIQEKIKAAENLIKSYYAEKRDKTARNESRAISEDSVPPHNLDENNKEILKAELKNLQLTKNPNEKTKKRIDELRRKLNL